MKKPVKTGVLHFRVRDYEKEKVVALAQKFNMTVSDIMREALTLWTNLNGKGA